MQRNNQNRGISRIVSVIIIVLLVRRRLTLTSGLDGYLKSTFLTSTLPTTRFGFVPVSEYGSIAGTLSMTR